MERWRCAKVWRCEGVGPAGRRGSQREVLTCEGDEGQGWAGVARWWWPLPKRQLYSQDDRIGTGTSPWTSGDAAAEVQGAALAVVGEASEEQVQGAGGGPASFLSALAGAGLLALELLLGPPRLCFPWGGGPGHPLPRTADPGPHWPLAL